MAARMWTGCTSRMHAAQPQRRGCFGFRGMATAAAPHFELVVCVCVWALRVAASEGRFCSVAVACSPNVKPVLKFR